MKVSEFAKLYDISSREAIRSIDHCIGWAVTSDTLIDGFAKSVGYAAEYMISNIESQPMIKARQRIPIDRAPRVYWLFDNSRLMYIGQAISMLPRLSEHKKYFDFTHVAVTEDFCGMDFRDYESLQIYHHRPPENKIMISTVGYFKLILKYIEL